MFRFAKRRLPGRSLMVAIRPKACAYENCGGRRRFGLVHVQCEFLLPARGIVQGGEPGIIGDRLIGTDKLNDLLSQGEQPHTLPLAPDYGRKPCAFRLGIARGLNDAICRFR